MKISYCIEEPGLKFNKEYKLFLKEYGAVSANGHEFLGICDSKRLNIIERTLEARKKNNSIPTDLYLIEDIGIDKMLTWQNAEGQLFQTVGKGVPERLETTLCEYVDS